jgi:hypothetical protein
MRQLKLGLEPGPQHNEQYLKESSVQHTIESGLGALGLLVLHTQHQYANQTCPTCHRRFRPQGGYGADKGIPDLLARADDFPRGLWLGLEIKGPRTAVSPEQQILEREGGIYICRTWESAEHAVRLTRQYLGK